MINTQSSIKIENIYFDPFKIEKEIHDASMIFITHAHYDHFDPDSIKKIENEKTTFIVPDDETIIRKLQGRNLFIIKPSKKYEINGLKFETVPAYNTNKPYHKKEYGWCGYVIQLDMTYYIMGDTDITEEASKIKCDYLFVPIGGVYTMNYEEGAKITNTIKPKIVTPIHYGSIVGDKSYGEKFQKLVKDDIKVKIML